MLGQAAISIDVDSLRFYRAIHGLVPERGHGEPIYEVALPRFFELLERVEVPATLFLIGADAARYPKAFEPVRRMGCEVASHSHRHDYRLSRSSTARIEDDLSRAERAIAPFSTDGTVVGFRAPGYNVSPALLDVLVRRGYRYDSSLLPSPMYWAARAAAIGRYAVAHRPSASMVGDARQFNGPMRPYRTAAKRPWKPVDRGPIVEIPMAVHPITRWPLIGTTWAMMPAWLRRRTLRSALARLPVFVFEMHAIDLLDATDAGISPELARHQPDLRVPVRDKIDAFLTLFRRLADERPMRTLREIAGTV